MQSKVQSSLHSTPWCGPVVGTCTTCTSGPSSDREPASGSAPPAGSRGLGVQRNPVKINLKKKRGLKRWHSKIQMKEQHQQVLPHAEEKLLCTRLHSPAGPRRPQPSSSCRTLSQQESHTPEVKHNEWLSETSQHAAHRQRNSSSWVCTAEEPLILTTRLLCVFVK